MGFEIELGDGLVVEVEPVGGYRDRRKAIAGYRRAYGHSPEVSAARAGVGVEELLTRELMGDEEYTYWFMQGLRHHWVSAGVLALKRLVGLLNSSDDDELVFKVGRSILQMFGSIYPKVLGNTLLSNPSSKSTQIGEDLAKLLTAGETDGES